MLLSDPLFIIAAIACFVVVAVLAMGIFTFSRGGEFNRKYGNRLMRWRIYTQGVAVALIVLYVYMRHTG